MQKVQPTNSAFIPFTNQSRELSRGSKCQEFMGRTTSTSSEASPSSRSGMRRLRTETTTPSCFTTTSGSRSTTSTTLQIYEEFQEHLLRLKKAFEKGNYDKALRMIDAMEPLVRKASRSFIDEECLADTSEISLEKLEKVRELASDVILSETKAYFHALLKDPKAIQLCDTGFQKIHEITNLVNSLRETDDSEESFQAELDFIENGHRFYRGLLQIGLGNREEAIQDLQSVLNNPNKPDFLEQISFWNTRELHLFFRVLEQKLGVELMPPGSEDEVSLRSSDNTEKAIQLFAEGDFEGAQKLMFEYPDLHLYLILPLVIRGFN